MRLTSTLSAALALAAAACGQGSQGGGSARDENDAGTVSTPVQSRATPTPAGSGAPRDKEFAVGPTVARPASSALLNAAYHRTGDGWEPVLFLCDGIDGDRVRIVTTPSAQGLSQLWTYLKPSFARSSVEVRLGDDDAGAGQVMRELRRPDGIGIGLVHSVNPGILGAADVTTLPTVSSVTVGYETTRCRWLPRGRVLFVDARRSVVVTAEPRGGFTYRSFDHASRAEAVQGPDGAASSVATATVAGGRLVRTRPGSEVYEFDAGPWTYRLTASADNRAPGATLTVLRSGRPVETSAAVAYVMAAAREE